MTKLRLADNVSLPLDVVTQTIAVVAKRRAGKSYFARRFVEQLSKAGQQVVVVDPKGDWWGLLYARDGKGPGLPFVIIGGERGHVPLEPGGGEVVAKLVVEERVSVLLDTSLLRKHEHATFMTAFLETLYRLKAQERYRTPLMLVVDEADATAPQKPQENEFRMLGAISDWVRRAGQRGGGCMLITQRTAVLSKDVLTQSQILVALRTIAPQDLKAMQAWIDVHGEDKERRVLMESLPSLPVGNAWVWSPGWPTDAGIFQRIHTAPIETFDSGATPKPGERRIEPKGPAEVDLDAVRRQMAETIERAKADDPKALRAELATVKKQLAAQAAVPSPKPAAPAKVKEVPALSAADRKALERNIASAEQLVDKIDRVGTGFVGIVEGLQGKLDALSEHLVALKDRGADLKQRAADLRLALAPPLEVAPGVSARQVGRTTVLTASPTRPATVTMRAPARGGNGAGEHIARAAERKALIVLAQYPGGRTTRQVAILAGYSAKGGGFRNALGALRSAGRIEGSGDALRITDAGLRALGTYEPLPTGDALREHWLGQLERAAEREVLRALCNAYPGSLTAEQVAAAAGYEAGGGGFRNALGKLRTLELIEGRGELRASAELFD